MNKNMQSESVIYALKDSVGNYGYIGSTRVNAKTRWWEHRSRARQGHAAPVYDWMRKSGIDSIEIEILEHIEPDVNADELEARLIKQFIDDGHPIQNQISRDGIPNSNGSRMKKILSESKKGKPTWIKGKRGIEAGWTEERRRKQAERMRLLAVQKNQ